MSYTHPVVAVSFSNIRIEIDNENDVPTVSATAHVVDREYEMDKVILSELGAMDLTIGEIVNAAWDRHNAPNTE